MENSFDLSFRFDDTAGYVVLSTEAIIHVYTAAYYTLFSCFRIMVGGAN